MSTLETLARKRNAARKAVLDWMNEQGAHGQFRTNSQAPGWVAYEIAEREFAAAVDAVIEQNENLVIQSAHTLKMSFRIIDGELYADTGHMLAPIILKKGEALSIEQYGAHLINVNVRRAR